MAPLRKPTTGVGVCCARAVSGIAARPPSRLMNSRRLIGAPEARTGAWYQPAPKSWKGGRQVIDVFGSNADIAVQKVMSAFDPIATSVAFFGMSTLRQKRTWRLARKCLNVFNLNNSRG